MQSQPTPAAMEMAARELEERGAKRNVHNQLVLELIQRYWIRQKTIASQTGRQGRGGGGGGGEGGALNELGMSMERDQSVDYLMASRSASPNGRGEVLGLPRNQSSASFA